VANFMMTYRRKRAVTMHVVHNSHLEGEVRPIAPLRASRRPVFENLPDFDAVVVLTNRQKADVEALLGRSPNVRVVPNSRDLDSTAPHDADRPIGRGIVLASLTSRKRVDHAVRAVLHAAEIGDEPVTLDVFGDGEERERLQGMLDHLGAGETVRLHGHDPRAREHLADASFIVLTGRTEGFPLVLVEAMAAGCIPIAYDVPYGPADIISHGRNGFLVPTGDEAGLTEAIVALQRMSHRKVASLRRRARQAAAQFSDSAVTATWAREMRLADARKRAAWSLTQAG
ncbi:MAG: glycosyltransferase, partial [Rhodoglobus sp.]